MAATSGIEEVYCRSCRKTVTTEIVRPIQGGGYGKCPTCGGYVRPPRPR